MEKLWRNSPKVLANQDKVVLHDFMLSVFRFTCNVSRKYTRQNAKKMLDFRKATRLQNNLHRFLWLFHHSWSKSSDYCQVNPSYEDVCAGLCSIALDLHVVRFMNGMKTNSSKTIATILVILGHSPMHILDAILQSSTLNKKYINGWNNICKKFLSSQPVESLKCNATYFKYILTLLRWKTALPKSKKNVPRDSIYSSVPPSSFRIWFQDNFGDIFTDVSACDSNSELIKALVKKNMKQSVLKSFIQSFAAIESNVFENSNVTENRIDGGVPSVEATTLFFIDKASDGMLNEGGHNNFVKSISSDSDVDSENDSDEREAMSAEIQASIDITSDSEISVQEESHKEEIKDENEFKISKSVSKRKISIDENIEDNSKRMSPGPTTGKRKSIRLNSLSMQPEVDSAPERNMPIATIKLSRKSKSPAYTLRSRKVSTNK